MSRMIPGTRALRTFSAAGRHLNFTRAAHELGLTPAAVSYQIKEIEDQLGMVLFTRTSRSIQLTPAGSLLLQATVDALAGLTSALGRARRMARGEAQLRISLGARFATHWLLPRLAAFTSAHPGLELTFDISDRLRDFEADDVDIALRFGAGHYPRTQSYRLFDTLVVPICSPKLISGGRGIQQPQDLLAHMLCYVDCQVDGMVWPNWRMWMTAAGIEDFDDSRCVAFADSSHVVQAVMDGSAIGLAELSMVASDIAQGRLVRLFDIGINVAPEYAYHLVYPHVISQDPRLIAFRTWILDQVAGDLPLK